MENRIEINTTNMTKKEKELVKVESDFNIQTIISQAVEKGTPVETMERLLAMRKDLKDEWAKEQYDKAMAKFQSECPTIVKTKEVKSGGTVAYRYAPIESIVEQVKLPLQTNGFSYSTRQELTETGVKISVKVTHSAGHSEVTEMSVPLGTKTALMSQSQVVAAASTFAKRYAFCNAFGILTGDEDNDGADLPKAKVQVRPTTQVKPAQVTPQAIPQLIPKGYVPNKELLCENCNNEITDKEKDYSQKIYGKTLCRSCQKEQNAR